MSAVKEAPVLLRAGNVTKTYRSGTELLALDNVSIEVREGECVGLIGPSGSGKSTLANVIAGLTVPDAGTVSFRVVTLPGTRSVAGNKPPAMRVRIEGFALVKPKDHL